MSSKSVSSCAILLPVHFPVDVSEGVIRETLEGTLRGQQAFCPAEQSLLVVDQGTSAERVLETAPAESPLARMPICRLARNRGKAEAVRAGLSYLLEHSQASFFITRDCDGDHAAEDLPRLLRMADSAAQGGSRPLSVFGARASWEKPMGWLRQEWERLSNRTLLDLTEYLAARRHAVLDRRFWGGMELDLQSGYRLYNRPAGRLAVQALSELPDDAEVYSLACETLPFIELSLRGGRVAQVQTLTRLGQPFSSYSGLNWPRHYGRLLAFAGQRYGAEPDILLQLFDNHLTESPLYWSDHRQSTLECRRLLAPEVPEPDLPSVR